MTVEFAFMADHEDALPTVANWYFDQWGHLVEGETLERSTKRLQGYMNNDKLPFVLIAILEGEVIGAAQLKFQEMAVMFPDKEHWIGAVYVSPKHRGHGIGSLIVEEIAAMAPRYNVTTLHLQTERLDGGIYAQLGWVPTDKVRKYGTDVLVMERQLDR